MSNVTLEFYQLKLKTPFLLKLQEEIIRLTRKGGHMLPPANPPNE